MGEMRRMGEMGRLTRVDFLPLTAPPVPSPWQGEG